MTRTGKKSTKVVDPLISEMKRRAASARFAPTIEQRFWEKVEKLDACWEWRARVSEQGYGEFSVDGKARLAHRVSYQFAYGEIPAGLVIDHMCANRICVNPAHLRAVTDKENTLAPWSKSPSKFNSEKTHCSKGHEYDEANTYRYKNSGKRLCRKCRVLASWNCPSAVAARKKRLDAQSGPDNVVPLRGQSQR